MKFQRRSAIAMAATTSGTLLVGVIAAVNVFDLQILGFNQPKTLAVAAGNRTVPSTTLATAVTAAPAGSGETPTTLAATVTPGASAGGSVAAPQAATPVAGSNAGVAAVTPTPAPVTTAAGAAVVPTPTTTRTTTPVTVAATTTTTIPRTTTTTAPPAAACAFTGIDTVGKYTSGGIEVEKSTNLATKVTVRTSGTCTGPMTMVFASPAYTLTLSGGGSSWTGTIPKGAMRGLAANQTLTATLKVGGAADAQVTLKTVVQSGSGSGSGS
jgi:hypothetical protein